MPAKKRTTVVLTIRALELKNKHAAVFGMKEILSVGLYLFDALGPAEQIEWITRVSAEEAAWRAAEKTKAHAPAKSSTRRHTRPA